MENKIISLQRIEADWHLPNNGGSQLVFASTWESRKIRTAPVACLAPSNLVLIKPSLLAAWITFTLPGQVLAT